METALQTEFERLLRENRNAVERYVKFKIPVSEAEDVLQEVYLAAYLGFERLENRDSFKAWIVGIARNKCRDRYREMARELELVDIESVPEEKLSIGIHGISLKSDVSEALGELSDRDSEILRLYYLKQLPQADIAKILGIPVGTVKSRLHYAKSRLRGKFPERLAPQERRGHYEQHIKHHAGNDSGIQNRKVPARAVSSQMGGDDGMVSGPEARRKAQLGDVRLPRKEKDRGGPDGGHRQGDRPRHRGR